jgi:hypothetical protein
LVSVPFSPLCFSPSHSFSLELNNIIIAYNWPESFHKIHPNCQASILTVFCCFSLSKNSSHANSEQKNLGENDMDICSLIEEIGEFPHELVLIITKMMMLLWPKEESHSQYYTNPKIEEKKEENADAQ